MFYKIVIFIIIIIIFSLKNSLANCDFDQSKYIREFQDVTSLKSIKINVNKKRKFYKNFARIFSSNSENIPLNLKKKFKADLIVNYNFGSCYYKAQIRQLGDWKDHIKVINGKPIRSLKVNLENGNIFNSVKFKLYIPETRMSYNEILGSILLRKLGFLSPETFETKVILNGSRFNMIFQEDIVKEFLEKNLRREGPIFEGDESLIWSYKNKENFKLEDISLSRLVNNKWFLRGESSEYISLKAFSKLQNSYLHYSDDFPNSLSLFPNSREDNIFKDYFFILTAMNGWHALRPHNRKFYFNPLLNKFEPIYYDGNLNLNSPIYMDLVNGIHKDDFKIFSKNYKFLKIRMLNEKHIKENILKDFKSRVISYNNSLDDFFNESISTVLQNSKFIQDLIDRNSKINLIEKNKDELVNGYIKRVNFHNINQENIKYLSRDKLQYMAHFQNGQKSKLSSLEVSNILRTNSLNNRRIVILDYRDDNKNKIYFKKPTELSETFINGEIIHSPGIDFNSNKDKKILNLYQSNPYDWIIFKNFDISNWVINFFGSKKTKITNTVPQRFNNQGLTGCLNFYNSKFDNITFNVNDGMCEDSINLINSNGSINLIKVKDSFSDGLDVDFSNLRINNLIIENAGNDCSDFSAGNYYIDQSNLNFCSDKAISIGENSNISLNNVKVYNSYIGIASKDSSITKINNLDLNNINTCVSTYNKKQEFVGSILQVKNMKCKNFITIQNADKLSKIIFENKNEL